MIIKLIFKGWQNGFNLIVTTTFTHCGDCKEQKTILFSGTINTILLPIFDLCAYGQERPKWMFLYYFHSLFSKSVVGIHMGVFLLQDFFFFRYVNVCIPIVGLIDMEICMKIAYMYGGYCWIQVFLDLVFLFLKVFISRFMAIDLKFWAIYFMQ